MLSARRHGGRLADAMAGWPDAPRPWLDLSTGINPRPWRGARASETDLARLPDPRDLLTLEAAAARAFGVEDVSRVAAVSGAETALRLLPALTGARTAAIAEPTYGSHAAAWRIAGVETRPAGPLLDETAEALVIVNPNNPDGRALPAAALLDLIRRREAKGLWTVIDESFVEIGPALSVAGAAFDRLIVLRSFGKFYGLPGVRLGFIVAASQVITAARACLGDWPVCADALVMGTAAYSDDGWRIETLSWLDDAARHLDADLAAVGLKVVGGTSLFRLVETPYASRLFERLCAQGVLTRPFDYCPTWLRIGLPPPADRARLAQALRAAA